MENENSRLKELLELSKIENKKIGLSEERIKDVVPELRYLISFFREYPDIFIDFITEKDKNCTFSFFYYQRIFLRVAMRHRYVYATYPRAYSKSFLSMLILMIRCILFPHAELFVTTGGKTLIVFIMIY